MGKVQSLLAYQKGFTLSMKIFQRTKAFPKEEIYSMTDQVRRSSRSVVTNLAEAYRRRRTQKFFESKRMIASPNYVKHKFGWSWHWLVSTLQKRNSSSSMILPMKSEAYSITW